MARCVYRFGATACLALLCALGSCRSPETGCQIADGECNFLRTFILYDHAPNTVQRTKFILIVDQGSPGTLRMYRQNPISGTLTEVSSAALGSTTQKGTTNGSYAYFANNAAPFDISMFSIQGDALISIGTIVVTISNPTFARLHPSNRWLYAGDNTGNIEIFDINSDGTLTSRTSMATGLSSTDDITFNARGDFAYVVGNTNALLLYYSVDANGSLTQEASTSTGITATFDTTVDHENEYLYVSNLSAANVSTFDIRSGTPVHVGNSTVTNFPFQTHLAPYPGNYAFATASVNNSFSMLHVDHDTGLMTETQSFTGLNFPTVAKPDAEGEWLYVSENTGGNVLIYDINQYTGTIHLSSTFSVGAMGGDVQIISEPVEE